MNEGDDSKIPSMRTSEDISLDTNQPLTNQNTRELNLPHETSGIICSKTQEIASTTLDKCMVSAWRDLDDQTVFKLLCFWIPAQWTKMDHFKITPYYAYLICNTSLLSFISYTKEWNIHKFHNSGLLFSVIFFK